MAGMSNYLENQVAADYVAAAASVWVGMNTADPQDGAVATEPVGNGYGRIDAAGKWTAPDDGATTNNAVLLSPEATGSWGTITWLTVWSAATGGNLLYSGPAVEAKAVGNSDVYRIKVGALVVTNS